jgi:hypothetical protein
LRDQQGYINGVQTLNDMSMAFVNSTYAESGRSLGYYDEKVVNALGTLGANMTEIQKANYKVLNTASYPLKYNASGLNFSEPYRDWQYMPDQAVLSELGIKDQVWFASRYEYTYTGNTYTGFGITSTSWDNLNYEWKISIMGMTANI